MPQYTCPKCKTMLKRSEPVPAGKKIKCPKCANIFAPDAGVPAGGAKDDDFDRTPYGVKTEEGVEETVKKEKERAARGLIRDRFEKSKRGPAMKRVVVPANLMTAAGVFFGIFYIVLFIVGVFPLVFRDYFLDEERFRKMPPAELQVYWEGVVLIRVIMMIGATVGFIYASLICVGAFNMRTLGSYGWAMTGAILTTLLGGLWLIVGIWCIITLRDEKVIEGFAEEPPPPHTGIT